MSFSYLPLYTGDYLRDTRHLSMCEHGAYLLALTHCWDSKGPMPLDERKQFAIVCARSTDEMEAWRRVRNEFFVLMEDGWYQPRMAREIERCEAISAARSGAGRVGANARMQAMRERQANAKQMPSNCLASAEQVTLSPSPSPVVNTEAPTVLVALATPTQPAAPAVGGSKALPPCPVQRIVDAYHEHLPTLPRVEVLSEPRKRAVSARWREVCAEYRTDGDPAKAALDWFAWMFRERVASSAFLTGRKKDWRANFDWLMKPANFVKVVEGYYAKETR